MTWTCIAVLPNICFEDSIEGGCIAIASAMDQRVGSATSQQPLLGDFLSQFYDTHDNPITPSVILWDSSSGQELPEFDAMCSFRDVVATSHVLLARARAMTASFPSSTQWMDSFSIYPWMLGRDAQNITCRTPAIYGLHGVKSFRGQSSPGLSCRSLRRGDRDHPLFDALCQKWVEVYSNRSTNHAAVALFRSLNMAYRAGSVPGEADATNYDYGRSVALWVSAFEILAHPGGSGRADLLKVYDLLERAHYNSTSVSNAVHPAYSNRKHSASKRNLACWLYGELYQARNDFLHGNPLSPDRLVLKGCQRHLLSYAAPLFRATLSSALHIAWTAPKPPASDAQASAKWADESMNFYVAERAVETALLTCKDAPRDRP